MSLHERGTINTYPRRYRKKHVCKCIYVHIIKLFQHRGIIQHTAGQNTPQRKRRTTPLLLLSVQSSNIMLPVSCFLFPLLLKRRYVTLSYFFVTSVAQKSPPYRSPSTTAQRKHEKKIGGGGGGACSFLKPAAESRLTLTLTA